MKAEIISIGTEILLGDIVDTNSKYIAEHLKDLGYDIHYMTAVGDNQKRVINVLKRAIERSDLVITTGGLGPTEDDLTRQAIAKATDKNLYQDENLLNSIKEYFDQKNYNMTKNNYSQAFLPEGAKVIKNNWGTAPGILLKESDYMIISLPGVPSEMKKMFSNYILKELQKYSEKTILSKTLHFFGIGESTLETKLKNILENQNNPTLALLAGEGEVKLRITAKGENKNKLKDMISKKEKLIRKKVGKYIYGVNNTDLAKEIYNILLKRKLTISLAESCTGGLISHRLTQIPGSSKVFKGSYVVYSNEAKINLLDIDREIIKKQGAVSKKTALMMAKNIKDKFGTNIGIGVTGIAGPGGGTADKPVGLVYIGISYGKKNIVHKLNLKYSRSFNKWMTSQYVFYYLLDHFKRGINKNEK
ncbi:MAG TPA: competence/damage-inducible protein A [Halanaerobiales bacterium]|nr:competence/damage-inducible protein A [Halanaerobiales bacterium]